MKNNTVRTSLGNTETTIHDKQQLPAKPLSNIAIVGLNRIGLNIYRNPGRFIRPNQQIVGFINVYPLEDSEQPWTSTLNLLGDFQDFPRIIQEHAISRVIVALDPHDVQKIHEVLQACQKHGVQYDLVSDLYDVVYGNTFKEILKDISQPFEFSIRRFFDLFFSILLFLLFLPSWIVIAIAIKFDSPGTVLYSQERVGKNGRIFRIFKFRSMRADAEKYSGPQLATQNDPRITRVGRILRKTRLDELPQLINVIVGDMSFIGPRPERPYFVEKYRREIPFYVNRLKVKPGLTGLAQVETGYDESIDDVRQKLKYDLYYIEHYNSITLNMKILLKTIWVVLTAQGQ